MKTVINAPIILVNICFFTLYVEIRIEITKEFFGQINLIAAQTGFYLFLMFNIVRTNASYQVTKQDFFYFCKKTAGKT